MADLRHGLRSDDPLELLHLVSALVIATRARPRGLPDAKPLRITLADLVDSFIGTNFAETTAALSIMAVILDDEVLAARIRQELARRRQPMPQWIAGLAQSRVMPEVWTMTDVLGDGDNYLLGLALSGGKHLTAVVYVDANLGGVVKDAFLVPAAPEEVNEQFRQVGLEEGQVITPTDAALARANITQALAYGSMMYPPLESESWPMCQALVEWLVRGLPDGGQADQPREWSQAALGKITKDFMSSTYAEHLDESDHRDLMESLLWFASSYAGCDPFRWSPVRVEILLVDWFPRKVIADADFLSKLPLVLRAYIRYCQDRVGIPASRREETLLAVDAWEPEYQRTIRSERLQGPEALIAAMLAGRAEGWQNSEGLDLDELDLDELDLDELDLDDFDLDDFDLPTYMLMTLERCVGDRATLMSLDADPLPDEPFRWAGIADDIRPIVEQVLADCDRVADDILDVELRTAMRRLLGRIAAGDPAIFRRKSSTARGAAAVAWLAYRANDDGRLRIQDLIAAFGITGSVSQRAEPMLKAIGIDPYRRYGAGYLGDADLLTADRRASIIDQRDRCLAMAEAEAPPGQG